MMETNDDLKMSLTEHLIELRKRLTNALIALGVGFLSVIILKTGCLPSSPDR